MTKFKISATNVGITITVWLIVAIGLATLLSVIAWVGVGLHALLGGGS